MSALSVAQQGRAFYRQLLRLIKQLPRGVQAHYQRTIRSEYIAHSDETDEEFLANLREQALRDAEWLLNKYSSPPAQQPGGGR